MARSVSGLFSTWAQVARVDGALRDTGFEAEQITIVGPDGQAVRIPPWQVSALIVVPPARTLLDQRCHLIDRIAEPRKTQKRLLPRTSLVIVRWIRIHVTRMSRSSPCGHELWRRMRLGPRQAQQGEGSDECPAWCPSEPPSPGAAMTGDGKCK
jgi:hypothetical protein